jgi:hypothetical protein
VDDYAAALERAVRAAVPDWLTRGVTSTAVRQTGRCSQDLADDAATMAREHAEEVVDELHRLLAMDVDAQRSNPLSVLRRAVRFPTEVLRRHRIPPVPRDDFAVRAFPEDVYGLSPATWSDVDESLQEPGLVWGAWKAKTILDRRRAEGRLSR